MMADGRVRWGILGTAGIAVRRLLPAFARSPTASVIAVASREHMRARDVARRFSIPKAYASYEALLEDPEVEAVYIPLPNSLHGPWTIRAADADKHILCEKPLARTAAEAAEMAVRCRRNDVLLLEAFMYRFHPQIERLRALVADTGRPWLVRSTFTFPVRREDDIRLNAELAGGGLMDVGCYCVNISRLLLGEPTTAFAAGVAGEAGVDVRLAGMLTFADGATAQFDCGIRAPDRQFCEVVGPEVVITVLRPFQPEEAPVEILVRQHQTEKRIDILGTNQYVQMIDHFNACVRGREALRYPPDDAVANMRVIDALYESARTRQPAPI